MAIASEKVPSLSQSLPPLIPRRRDPTAPLEPAPETPKLPLPGKYEVTQFKEPSRRILSPKDLQKFQESPTYTLVLAFVFGISDAVRGTKISTVASQAHHESVNTILSMLDEATAIVKNHPPQDIGSRFGNPSFRTWLEEIKSKFHDWHERLNVPVEAISELSIYLEHSFGSSIRLDYGSGHELNLFLWLLCLNRLSLLPPSTFQSLALIVVPRYLTLMREVQISYYLEPAGSHGVWGLDDYQFLPFLFGSSQLVSHPFLRPKSIHNEATIEECSKDYLYFNQVAFVNSTKTVKGLRWHSPMLDDISGAKSWEKIEAGMKKMFVKEVLGKLPVMQHFLFGSLIPAVDGMSEETGASGDGHDHDHATEGTTWGDCCGIKVPSSLGAFGEQKKGGEEFRRIPFD
jgi:serine/threonine-protein phosphatase 2A activator